MEDNDNYIIEFFGLEDTEYLSPKRSWMYGGLIDEKIDKIKKDWFYNYYLLDKCLRDRSTNNYNSENSDLSYYKYDKYYGKNF